MAKKEEDKQKHNFFEIYPNNPSLAQYMQDLATGLFERTSVEPEGSIWGTYRLVCENSSQQGKPNQEKFNQERLNQERLDQERLDQERLNQQRLLVRSSKEYHASHLSTRSLPLTRPPPMPDDPISFPPRPPSVFAVASRGRAMPSGAVHFNHCTRPTQNAIVHGYQRMLLAPNPADMPPNLPSLPLRSSYGTAMKRIVPGFGKSYACERRHEYNKLFEKFVADTTPLSPADSTTAFHETSNRELLESHNFAQGTKEPDKVATMANPNLHDFSLDYQSPTVASSMTSLQSDPSSTLERSDIEESSCHSCSPAKDTAQGTCFSKDREAHELSFPRLSDTQTMRNPKKIQLREMRSRPTFRDDSFTLNLNRRPCRKTSTPNLNISNSSLSNSPDFQIHGIHNRNQDEN